MIEGLHSISARPVSEPAGAAREGGVRGEGQNSQSQQGDFLDLSPEAEAQLRKLKQRDQEVRAHEKAHIAASGGNAVGAPHYEYQRGPDGKQYAIGGHVDISLSTSDSDPEESEKNARQVRRAAMAPGQPSGQDMAVAAKAARAEAEAKAEKLEERREENDDSAPDPEKRLENDDSLPDPEKLLENGKIAEAETSGVNRIMRKAAEIYDRIAKSGTPVAPFGEGTPALSLSV